MTSQCVKPGSLARGAVEQAIAGYLRVIVRLPLRNEPSHVSEPV